MPNANNTRSLFELTNELWTRRKWVFILSFLAMFAAAVTIISNLPKLYQSSATVLVGQDNISDNFVKSSVSSDIATRLQFIKYELLSRTRLEQLVNRFNLYPEIRKTAPPEVISERMRKDIQFDVVNTTQQWGQGNTIAFTLSYQGFDPVLVAEVTNTLASSYMDENKRLRGNQAATTTTFLEKGLIEAKAALDSQQKNDQGTTVVRRVVPDTTPTTLEQERSILTANLTGLRQELAMLQSRFTDKYPDVIRVKGELARLEQQLSQMPVVNRSVVYAEQVVAADPSRTVVSLEEASGERYLSLLARYEDAQLAEILEQQGADQFQLVEAAVPSILPVQPQVIRLALLGLILSLGFAAGMVMLVEQFDNSIYTVRDLKDFTRVPILVTIPRIETSSDRVKHWLSLGFVTVLATTGIALIVQVSHMIASENQQLVWFLAQRGI